MYLPDREERVTYPPRGCHTLATQSRWRWTGWRARCHPGTLPAARGTSAWTPSSRCCGCWPQQITLWKILRLFNGNGEYPPSASYFLGEAWGNRILRITGGFKDLCKPCTFYKEFLLSILNMVKHYLYKTWWGWLLHSTWCWRSAVWQGAPSWPHTPPPCSTGQYSTVQYSTVSTVQEARHGRTRHLPAVLVLTEHQVGPPVDGHTHPQLAHNVQSKYNT